MELENVHFTKLRRTFRDVLTLDSYCWPEEEVLMFLIKEVVTSELYFRKVPLVITCRTDGEGNTDVREAVLEGQ